jgi:hypothetical protein
MNIRDQKLKLEIVIRSALERAILEINNSGVLFSEESLRYIVVDEISKANFWGNFPNNSEDKKLVFEYAYPKFQREGKKGTYRPDIVSLKIDANGNVSEENLLAIELKISSWATKDIVKCREYLNPKKGKKYFQLSAVVLAPHPKNQRMAVYRTTERKRLQSQKKMSQDSDLRILFAWVDPKTNQPELFWIS